MVFKCQEDSFLKEFTTKVVTCEKTKEPIVEYGKTSKFEGYAVTLEDTILFPAGGGQPHDLGWLNDVEVLQVLRRGEEAVHFTREPLEPGVEVAQRLDWERRFDHMQQHSGQHLLSRVLEQRGLATTSWWLGAEECHVELDSAGVSGAVLQTAEECHVELDSAGVSGAVLQTAEARCNELIRQALPVTVNVCRRGDEALDEAHTRGLPHDCPPTIRVVRIAGVDENMCCGTHVSNLSQLQVIKLLGSEPGKKGKSNARFIVGGRVVRTLAAMLAREQALTGLLNNEPKKHVELVQKLQKNLKITNKNLQCALSELAQAEVARIKLERPKFVLMCRKEATPEFNRAVCKGLETEAVLLCLAAAEPEKQDGQLLLQGPAEHCRALGKQITELLKAKGAFKNGKFQGKAGDLSAPTLVKCNKLLQDYFDKL